MSNAEKLYNILDDKTLFPDLPKTGPLARYRKRASFDYRKLALLLESEESYRMKVRYKYSNFVDYFIKLSSSLAKYKNLLKF